MLWFALLSGLVMLFLILAQGWSITHIGVAPSSWLAIPVGDSTLFIDLQQNQVVALQTGSSSSSIDLRLFLMEVICLSGFTLILAGLVLYRSGRPGKRAVTVREGWAGVRASSLPLAVLSTGLAFIATIGYPLIQHSRFFGSIVHGITMALFWLPYSFYEPQGIFAVLYASANFFALEIMVINGLLLLAALYLVPAIVLEKKGLLLALAGSAPLFRRTWREVLGCILVFAFIILGVGAVGLLIGQSPALLNHDYDFFLSPSRGYLPMMVVCYGFIIGCWILMAAGFTAAGAAITDLYHVGKNDRISGDIRREHEKSGTGRGSELMRLIAGTSAPWLGLCRKPPAMHALQVSAGILPAFAHEGVPGGGSGGPGAIRRGIGAALSGMGTLNRNRHLLWFTLLAGLVLAGNAIGQAALRSIGRTMQPDILAYSMSRTLFSGSPPCSAWYSCWRAFF